MRTTVSIDDDVINEARKLTGITENAALKREALQALIQRESARQSIQLGGTALGMEQIPRRQSDTQRYWLIRRFGSTSCEAT